MTHPKFDEKELNVVSEIPNMFDPSAPGTPIYDFPVTPREAYIYAMKRDPIWQLMNVESMIFTPKVYPDNVARALVVEAEPLAREDFGGKDMFGIEWEYVDVAGGSMVKPGAPLLEDANEWYDKVVWPDINSYDWEASAKANEGFCKSGEFYHALDHEWIL